MVVSHHGLVPLLVGAFLGLMRRARRNIFSPIVLIFLNKLNPCRVLVTLRVLSMYGADGGGDSGSPMIGVCLCCPCCAQTNLPVGDGSLQRRLRKRLTSMSARRGLALTWQLKP